MCVIIQFKNCYLPYIPKL